MLTNSTNESKKDLDDIITEILTAAEHPLRNKEILEILDSEHEIIISRQKLYRKLKRLEKFNVVVAVLHKKINSWAINKEKKIIPDYDIIKKELIEPFLNHLPPYQPSSKYNGEVIWQEFSLNIKNIEELFNEKTYLYHELEKIRIKRYNNPLYLWEQFKHKAETCSKNKQKIISKVNILIQEELDSFQKTKGKAIPLWIIEDIFLQLCKYVIMESKQYIDLPVFPDFAMQKIDKINNQFSIGPPINERIIYLKMKKWKGTQLDYQLPISAFIKNRKKINKATLHEEVRRKITKIPQKIANNKDVCGLLDALVQDKKTESKILNDIRESLNYYRSLKPSENSN